MPQKNMDNDSFLAYLRKKEILSEEQIQTCQQALETTSQELTQILLQKAYCDNDRLKEYLLQFESEQNTPAESMVFFEEKDTVLKRESPQTSVASSHLSFEMPQNNFIPKNRYILLETIGEGGMGIVQNAKDSVLGREVALKKVNAGCSLSSQISQKNKIQAWRLSREAEITAILEHPNIIPLYDIQYNEDGELYFTMRKVEGETLTELLRKEYEKNGSFRVEQRLSVFFKICDAVSYAHSKNIIHRDLKPDNVMVGKFGEVYVMDWGIAKKIEEEQEISEIPTGEGISSENFRSKTIVEPSTIEEVSNTLESNLFQGNTDQLYATIGGLGTPGYMAPEQSKNASQATKESDIYALGIILRQLFVLLSPYEELKILHKMFEEKRISSKTLSHKNQENNLYVLIPSDLQSIIQKATDSDPVKRYSSIPAFVFDIECYQKNIRVSARNYNPWQLFSKWIRRNKFVFIGILLLFMLLSLFGIYLQLEKKQQREGQISDANQKAYQEEKFANQQKGNAGIQMKALLKALHYLDIALSLKPLDPVFEQKKYALGKQLIQLACKSEDYNLAEYVSTEMNTLSFMTSEEKTKLQKDIQIEKNRILKEHQDRLHYWLDELKKKPYRKIKEKAVFEIVQMKEHEIFQELLALVVEGTTYLLEDSSKNTGTIFSYQTLFEILRGMNQDQAIPTLVQQLQKIKEKWATFSYEEIEIVQCGFTLDLLDALITLKAKNIAKILQEMRNPFAKDHLFFKDSEDRYYKLLALEEVTTAPKTAEDFLARGHFKNAINDFSGAIEDFTQAIQLNPKYVQGYVSRAKLYGEKQSDKALQDYAKAIQLEPSNNELYALRGELKFKIGDIKSAARDFQKYIEKDQSHANVYRLLGMIRRMLKDLKGAIAEYDKAIQISPNGPYLWVLRGIVKYESGDLQGALSDYNQALILNPNHGNTFTNRGVVRLTLGDIDGAIFDFNHAIELEKVSPLHFLNRGDAWQKKGDFHQAILDYNQAILLDPQFLEGYFRSADCYQRLGKHTNVIQRYEKVIEIQPLPKLQQQISHTVANYILQEEKKGEFTLLKPYLLFFKKYATRFHPKYNEIMNLLEKVEQAEQAELQIKKEKK